ncbi:M96 mating-specific protein [Phytophthora megakarya]|uniref:M96 mating-specific protein n=1 Tax=Phytophthora megakarya TaxID=4795 RepID=A0A225WQV1_9STRA|nr:M96 mating-specific protein [Phytophthora megakarya]
MAFIIDDEDEAVLEATLSYVDAFRDDSCAPSPQIVLSTPNPRSCTLKLQVSSGDQVSKQALKNERKRLLRHTGVYGDPNRARNERRREIAMLRTQLEQLQLDLRVLQTQQVEKETIPTNALVTTTSTPQVPSMWQQIATQQRRRRREVESENVRLKLAVDRQHKVADDLQNLLQRKARQLASECSSLLPQDGTKCHHIVTELDLRGDIGDFPLLFRRLELARQEVDVVFAANGLADMVVTPSDIHIREGKDGKYLEAFSNKLLAFKLRPVTEALWSHFKSLDKHAGNGHLYEKAEKYIDETNTILEDFTMEMHSNTSRADIRVKQVIRRYIEADRDILIWVSRVSPVEIKHRMLRGLTYHLRGHAIAKRSSASTPGNELSQLQFCSFISFDREAQSMYDRDSVRAVMNFLIVNTAHKMKVHQDRVENILVEQTLRREKVH